MKYSKLYQISHLMLINPYSINYNLVGMLTQQNQESVNLKSFKNMD
jgi:hypothetical protein